MTELFTFAYNQAQQSCCEIVYFLPTGDILVSSWPIGPASIISVQKQRFIANIYERYITAVGSSLSGQELFIGCYSGEIQLWDLPSTKKKSFHPKYHENLISKVSYISPNLIASSSLDGYIKVIDNRNLEIVNSLKVTHYGVPYLTHQPQQQLFAAPCEKDINIWDLRKFDNILYTLTGHNDLVSECEFHPTILNMLVSCSSEYDHVLMRWDLQTGTSKLEHCEIVTLNGSHILFYKDSEQIIYSNDNKVYISNEGPKMQFPKISCMDLDPSGTRLAVGCGKGKVQVLNVGKWNKRIMQLIE